MTCKAGVCQLLEQICRQITRDRAVATEQSADVGPFGNKGRYSWEGSSPGEMNESLSMDVLPSD